MNSFSWNRDISITILIEQIEYLKNNISFLMAMYILASDFFEKDDKSYLKLEIIVVCKEFLVFN